MKGFKPTGHGMSSGFKFPSHMGFTGSTGNFTTVSPYVRRRAFANGGFVQYESDHPQTIGDQGSALVRRARASTALDEVSGGKTPVRPGFKRGGKCMMKDGGKWIQGAIQHPGALHRALNVPQGKKIPAKKLAQAAHSDNPTMRRRAALAKTLGKMHKADGGDVKLPRRKTPYTFMQSLRAVPGAIKEGVRYALSTAGGSSSGMAKRAADTISGREKQIDDYVNTAETGNEPTASNYSRGGKMKRMGYAEGGRRDGSVAEPPPLAIAKKAVSKPPVTTYPPAATIKAKFYSRGGAMKRMGYATGGGVTASQAQHIAERTIGKHVRYPAPKGHKGLEKVMHR